MTKTVAIIGGGVGGLATANLLANSGYIVSIFESRSQLGGRMGLLEIDGFRFDTGPSWYLMPEVYQRYFELLDKTVESQFNLVKLSPAYKVFFENEPSPIVITGDKFKDTKLFENRQPGAGKQLTRYLDDAEKIYKLALKNFLYTNFKNPSKLISLESIRRGPAMLRRSLTPMDRFLGKYFKDPGLRQIMGYPAVFLGSSPYEVPALYQLMSYLDFRQGVFYPMGGMYSVTDSLINIGKELGVKYHLDSPISSIIIDKGTAKGVRTDDKEILADIVISNADLHFTQTKLLPVESQDYPKKYWQKRQPGPSALLIYLGIKGKLPQLNHHNLFFVQNWESNFEKIFKSKQWPLPASIYACKPSETDNSVAPKNHENVFILIPLPADPDLHDGELESYSDEYIDQIAKQSNIVDLKERIITKKLFGPKDFQTEFNSWDGTALGLSHNLKQSAMFRPSTKSKKVENLYYVGANTQPGIGVPMCLISAELVYTQIVKNIPKNNSWKG